MIKKFIKAALLVILLVTATSMATPQTVSARSFGGHSSFHSTPHVYHSYGGSRGFHSTPRYKAPDNGKSFHFSPKPKTPDNGKKYRLAPKAPAVSTNPNKPAKAPGLFSGFGRSIVHGAGWTIGSNMGNSLWHSLFGFGGNRYIGSNGQVQYQQGGHSGWVLIITIIIIGVVIYIIVKKRK